MRYKDLVTVAPRFARAVNLERDATVPSAIDGYILTSTAQQVLDRLAYALAAPSTNHAWTLTGPYGSGKSAFALYLANLFGPSFSPGNAVAKSALRRHCEPLHTQLFDRRKRGSLAPFGFCPILLSGEPGELLPLFLRAACRDIRRYCLRGRPPAGLNKLEKLQLRVAEGKAVPASAAVTALSEVATSLQASGRSQGILIIIDELGKFLEFASRAPDRGDVFLLQQLAEATGTAKSPCLYLITILHQSFDRYAAGLRTTIRDEWAKVQGRFEDIVFQEPPEQLLEVIAHAISQSNDSGCAALRETARQLVSKVASLGLAPRGFSANRFSQAMVRCAPLHPLTVLVLIRLCRKFGQNQRSLFSFLVSRESGAFSNFLEFELTKGSFPFYGLANLYDYVAQAFGNGLTTGESATRWVELESALDRCKSASSDEINLVKVIGMLSAVGAYGEIKPSEAVVELGFGGKRSDFQRARDNLLRRSVAVYRKHSESFALWEGSDVDIDERVHQASSRIAESGSVARKLDGLWAPRPLVAKRHSFQRGTLRYFDVRFLDAADFPKGMERDPNSDGLLIYCLPSSRAEFDALVELAKGSPVRDRSETALAIPQEIDALRHAVRELECLRWVENNTPELKGDVVARRELRVRIAIAQEQVAKEIHKLFSPGEPTARNTLWFRRGIPQGLATPRTLVQFLSDICDEVYAHTPRLRNELINRRTLSSAAAKARRNLIDAMISHSEEERLGIAGNPPELSMYLSVLGATGIHRKMPTGYEFRAPQSDSGLIAVWKEMEAFFTNCELQRRSVSELFASLQQPPFGLKMGIIPVLFCAAALAHDTEIALYENGSFVPELTVDTFERLLSSPDKFAARRYRIAGVRREVFHHLATLFGPTMPSEDHNLVSAIKPLYRFLNRLPQYTLQTKTLSETAQAVRQELLNARDPDVLLFDALPRACGVDPFLPMNVGADQISRFFGALKVALLELQRAYDDLLLEQQQLLLRAFSTTGPDGRELLRDRAQAISEFTVDLRLQGFSNHLTDSHLDDVAWIEAIATFAVGKTPRMWADLDRSRYEVRLTELVRNFRHVEALVFELTKRRHSGKAAADVLRIGITDRHSREREAVVVIESKDQARVSEALGAIEEYLERAGLLAQPELALGALAIISRRFLSELETSAGETAAKEIKEMTRG